MAVNKKIVVSLPETLLEEFDKTIDHRDNKNRSKFIREAVILYIRERKRGIMNELMKKGYQEMAELNVEMAECGIDCDYIELDKYEAVLAESDIIDDTGGEKRRYILC